MQYKPWGYQKAAEQWILDHPACGLFLEMGLGKTVTTLSAIVRLLDDYAVTKVLVVAPLRVAMTVWAEEAAKWDHTKHLRVVKVLGKPAERLAALSQPGDIYVINREMVGWLVQNTRHWDFDMVVLDELSSFKSRQSERWRFLKLIRPKVSRIVGLTGTPAPNGLIDLWSQIYLLDQGQRLEKTLGAYRQRYFVEGKRGAKIVYEWLPKPEAPDIIYAKISDICMSMTAKDYLTLPDRMDHIVKIPMSAKTAELYERLRRDLVLPYKGTVITAVNAAVLSHKLLQMANGAVYDGAAEFQWVHDHKLDALEDIVEAANGQPVLVYYAFKHDMQRIQERLPQSRQLTGADMVKRWNEGKVPVLLAHPDSAGHGLNLQAGGHIIVWYGLTWSLEKYQQANARLHRQGQREPVSIYHLVTEGTIDERVMDVLSGKALRQDALIDAVKAVVNQ